MALTLRDGTFVPVRRIRAEDAAALQRLVGRSSDRSIELRFFGPLKKLSDEMAERFAAVDGKDRFALVALDPQDPCEIVAVVRYEREKGTDGAEYAALIEDRFQGRGLGIGLTRGLIDAARENGIGHLYALVLRENVGMLRLLRSLDLPERIRLQDGADRVEIDLGSPGLLPESETRGWKRSIRTGFGADASKKQGPASPARTMTDLESPCRKRPAR